MQWSPWNVDGLPARRHRSPHLRGAVLSREPGAALWHEACPPKPWRRQVSKVQHYWLEVSAMTRPMQIRENEAGYAKGI